MLFGLGLAGPARSRSHSRAERALRDLSAHRVVERLHHQQDDRAPRPPLIEQHLASARDAGRTSARVQRPRAGRRRRRSAVAAGHRVAALAVGDDLDVGVGVGMDARGDRDAVA